MDPQLEEYMKRILSVLGAIAETQERQREEYTSLVQQVESASLAVPAQNDRLEEMNSLTLLKAAYKPIVEDIRKPSEENWARESQASSTSQTSYNLQVPSPCDQSLTTESQASSTSQTSYNLQVPSPCDQSLTTESQASSTLQTSHSLQDVDLSQKSSSKPDILTDVNKLLLEQTKNINSTLKDERYFLRDQLGKAQEEILDRLTQFQQPGTSLTGFDKEVKHKLSTLERVEEKLDNLHKTLSGELDKKIIGLSNETAKEIKEIKMEISNRNVSQEQAQSGNLFDKTVEDLKASNKDLSQTITEAIREVPTRVEEKHMGDILKTFARTTEELKEVKHVMNKTGEQIEKIQIVPDLSADIRTCIETVKGCQRETKEHIQRSDNEIKKLQWCFGISVLLILCPLFLSFCLSPPGTLCVEVVKDNQMKTEEAIQRSRDDLSKILNYQQRMDQKVDKKFNDLARLTEFQSHFPPLPGLYIGVNKSNLCTEELTELKDVTAKIGAQFHKTQNVQNLTAEIRICTETVKDCQKETEEYIHMLSIEISTMLGLYGWFSVLLTTLTLIILRWKSNQKIKELSSKLYRSKFELFSYVEKESQLIRDRQQPPAGVGERKKYICYFYVEQFKDLIRSEEIVKSYSWHVHQWQTSVQGYVRFKSDGNMAVWLMQGRKVRELGLEPRSDIKLKVTATVTDLSGTIENYRVGEDTWTYTENWLIDNRDWGRLIGDVSCQKLIDLGFASKEKNYLRGAILVVYKIEVL